jgi:hypothetical protein
MINVIDYVRLGYKIIPLYSCVNGICTCPKGNTCTNPGKHPHSGFVPNGLKNATSSERKVAEWLAFASSTSMSLNWAIVLGEGTFAVDVDPRNGGDVSLKELEQTFGTLESPMYADTGGGGHHILYRSPHKIVKSGAPWKGVDIKGSNGYIVVEPSVHKSGKRYAWRSPLVPVESLPFAPRHVLDKTQKGFQALADNPSWDGVDASETPVGKLFVEKHLLGVSLGDGKRAVRCPWFEEHSDGRGDGKDDSSVVLPGKAGVFKCLHGHCLERKNADVFAKLNPTEAGIELLYENTKKGPKLIKNSVNLIRIIQSMYHGCVATSRILGGLVERQDVNSPWERFDDSSYASCKLRICEKYGLDFAETEVRSSLRMYAESIQLDPVKDYLKGLHWDGVRRLDTWLSNYLGTPDSSYEAKVGAWWMISAVARVFEPGCPVHTVLILEGEQGVGKSSSLRILGGAWFSDEPLDFGAGPATAMLLQRGWIFELGELDSLSRARASAAKAFLSKSHDQFRKPYGTEVLDYPRHCVFAGSVNHSEYLTDDTGNRRYWPVKVSKVLFQELERDRDQLWAEAVTRFKKGAVWYPRNQEELTLTQLEQSSRETTEDSWTTIIRKYVSDKKDKVIPMEHFITHALGMLLLESDDRTVKRIGHALRKVGWERVRVNVDGVLISHYKCKK